LSQWTIKKRSELVENIAIEKRLGISVKNWRNRLELSQLALAQRSGFHRSYISDVERGARNVSLKSIEKLSEALGISVLTLFSDVSSKTAVEALHADELAEILLVEDPRHCSTHRHILA
jgi:transcriptional regulator with XRE-family HTH domain